MSAGIRRLLPSAAAGLTALALSAGLASGQSSDTEARLRAQLRDSTLQLRAAQDENASLRAHQQELEQQLKSAAATTDRKAGERAEGGSGALRKALAEREARIGELQEQFAQTIDELGTVRQAARKAEDELRARTAEAGQLRAQAAERQAAYAGSQGEVRSCEDKNRELVTISGELLSAYEDKGVWSALKDAEPLTQIHRVRLQSLAQDYDIKIKDRTLSGPAQQPATAPHQP